MDLLTIPNTSRRPSTVSISSLTPTSCSHEQPMVVYCDTCSQPICDTCLIGEEHRSHIMKTLGDACNDQIDKIDKHLKDVETKAKDFDIQQWVKRQKEHLESEFKRVQDDFTEKYTELQNLLDHSRKQALELLKAQQESQKKTLYQQVKDTENFKIRAHELQVKIENLKGRISYGEWSTLVLGEIEVYQMSSDTVNTFYKTSKPNINIFDKSRMDALKKSIQDLIERSRDIFPRPWEFYRDVTFGMPTDSTLKNLTICDDRLQIFISPNQMSSEYTYQGKDTPVHILGEQAWKNGQHYWEVDVKSCLNWAVGIVERGRGNWLRQAVPGRLGRDKRSWMLESDEGQLAVRHNDLLKPVGERQIVRCLGVYVDMTKNKSRLIFYDVGRNMALHTFDTHFKNSVYPAFTLYSVGDQVQSLALCNLGLSPTYTVVQ